MQSRQIILDTETTGMNKFGVTYEGHRIIEIGAVEVINRRLTGRHFHVYIKPDRLVDFPAFKVHGISDEFLYDKPEFKDIFEEFIDFIKGSELVIHNAPFDVGFMDHEFKLLGQSIKTHDICKVTDSLTLARQLFPGKRNSLDAICSRLGIDNSKRTLHGALLDAQILADVYLTMTGGQTSLSLASLENEETTHSKIQEVRVAIKRAHPLKVVYASTDEIAMHEARLDTVMKKGKSCLWRERNGTIEH
ncbi:DNA polymerase III subunit epsilon [Thorsellia anophelis]|uniref:DNA polymerase III subunit epsilon n=1 Tax=Thorsellia anophelis DSM 18579 TaxID=1123402 RepID=A0A1H9YST0_9GAMM|nr:DNA polymerase III subunit epsilon [Thorsellia anophelis]SES72219.1 DNA polymerase-3 subunit epsilon [Thorsellia anophelis DSM 18579]